MKQGQDEVVQEILKFVKEHHSLIFHILGNEPRAAQLSDLEEIQLVTAILSKVRTLDSFAFPKVAVISPYVVLFQISSLPLLFYLKIQSSVF